MSTSPGIEQTALRRRRWLMPQKTMRRMLYALSPVALSGVYFFGWRVAAILGVCLATGLLVEGIMSRRRGQPISTACLVTCTLFALSLPSTVPYWIAVVGAAVAVLFGKEVFGGFGRNFCNPAIVGRAFVYICFPVHLTAHFVPAFRDIPGGLGQWSMESFLASAGRLPAYLAGRGLDVADAVTQASPLYIHKVLGPEVTERAVSLWDMMLGSLGGTFEHEGSARILAAGSIGEGCALLIVLCAVYLLVTKTANWRLMLSAVAGLAFASVLFRDVLGFNRWVPGRPDVAPFLYTLFGGTTIYAVVFMVTDPVSAPKKRYAQIAYGFLIGCFVVLLRWRGVFVAAATFSILLGNILGPWLDLGAGWLEQRKKPAAEPGQGADK